MLIDYASVGYVHLIAAIICAKWALDLGFTQFRQLLWGIAGFVAAPLILLILYTRLIRKCTTEAGAAADPGARSAFETHSTSSPRAC